MADKYAVDVAYDGLHFQRIKSGGWERMWELIHGLDVSVQLTLNPFAKARLMNVSTGRIIGERGVEDGFG